MPRAKGNPLSITPPAYNPPRPAPTRPVPVSPPPEGYKPIPSYEYRSQEPSPSAIPMELMQSTPVTRGISSGVGEIASSMASPQGLALMGGIAALGPLAAATGFPVFLLQALVRTGFTVAGIKGLAESLPGARDAFTQGDVEEGVRQVVHSIANVGMAVAPWKGAKVPDFREAGGAFGERGLAGQEGFTTVEYKDATGKPIGGGAYVGIADAGATEIPPAGTPASATVWVKAKPVSQLEIPKVLNKIANTGLDPKAETFVVGPDSSPRTVSWDEFTKMFPEAATYESFTPPPPTVPLPGVPEVPEGPGEFPSVSPLPHTPKGQISYVDPLKRKLREGRVNRENMLGLDKAEEVRAQQREVDARKARELKKTGVEPGQRVDIPKVEPGAPVSYTETPKPPTAATPPLPVGGTMEQILAALLKRNDLLEQQIEMYRQGQVVAPQAPATPKKAAPAPVTKTPVAPAAPTYTPDHITDLPPDSVFVFGSNTEGRHGAGAAKLARDKFGAVYGQAKGLQGRSYGIVTKDLAKGNRSVPLSEIGSQIDELLQVARQNPGRTFVVTKIGTGLGGFSTKEIAGLFAGKDIPPNVTLPREFASAMSTVEPDIEALVAKAIEAPPTAEELTAAEAGGAAKKGKPSYVGKTLEQKYAPQDPIALQKSASTPKTKEEFDAAVAALDAGTGPPVNVVRMGLGGAKTTKGTILYRIENPTTHKPTDFYAFMPDKWSGDPFSIHIKDIQPRGIKTHEMNVNRFGQRTYDLGYEVTIKKKPDVIKGERVVLPDGSRGTRIGEVQGGPKEIEYFMRNIADKAKEGNAEAATMHALLKSKLESRGFHTLVRVALDDGRWIDFMPEEVKLVGEEPVTTRTAATGVAPKTAEALAAEERKMTEAGMGTGEPFTHREGIPVEPPVQKVPTKEELSSVATKPEQVFKGARQMEMERERAIFTAPPEAIKATPPPSAETTTAMSFKERNRLITQTRVKLQKAEDKFKGLNPDTAIGRRRKAEIDTLREQLKKLEAPQTTPPPK